MIPGRIKQTVTDFEVTEELGFDCSGDGEHDYLWAEKSGANTNWVARALARHAGVPLKDVGFAGQKDRHALTRQWFSVRRPTAAGTDWQRFEVPGVTILGTNRHQRKLKRGAHSGNAFRIAVRGIAAAVDAIPTRLGMILRQGVPNYFGAQRFGRGGNNLNLAGELFAGKRLKRELRSIALSAARSLLFNEILSARIADRTWNRGLAGEALNLDGSAGFFVAGCIDEALQERLDSMDIHPTGALWGRGELLCRGTPADREREVAAKYPEIAAGLEDVGVSQARRALRLAVRDLRWDIEGDVLRLAFRLVRGSYATSVLREIVTLPDG